MLKRLEVMTVASQGGVSPTHLEPAFEPDAIRAAAAYRDGGDWRFSGVYVVCCLGAEPAAALPAVPAAACIAAPVDEAPAALRTLEEQVSEVEQRIIGEALRRNNHKRTETARELGISRVTLYNKMKKFGMLGQ